jgi:1-acyl-sn-glycerol-3-phosphate acyltransferase
MVRFRVEGDLSAIPREGPLIIAANHASSADPVLIGAFLNEAMGRPLNWLGKRELTEFPLTGWAFRRAGIHPVDREAADLEAFRTAMRILEAGHVLAVFPEGTRSRDGRLGEGRAGAALLAMRTGVPVLPVGIAGTHRIFPGRSRWPHRSRVTIRIGTPFSVAVQADGLDRAALRAGTEQMMRAIAALLPEEQRGRWGASSTVD